MLCSTCRFYSQGGYCGQGRAVEQPPQTSMFKWVLHSNCEATHEPEPFSCSGYVEGDNAIAMHRLLFPLNEPPLVSLPFPLNELVISGRRHVLGPRGVQSGGIPFPVRVYTENRIHPQNGLGYTNHTIVIVEGDVGHLLLSDSLNGQTMFLIEGDDLTISINSSYTLQRGGPIVVEVTYSTWQHGRIDLSPYLWWLDPDVPEYAVELYLLGLMELYHARLPDVIQVADYGPQDFTVAWPPRPPSSVSYTTTMYRFREVYQYLCKKYVETTRDYHTWSVRKVEYEARRWGELMQWYCNQL